MPGSELGQFDINGGMTSFATTVALPPGETAAATADWSAHGCSPNAVGPLLQATVAKRAVWWRIGTFVTGASDIYLLHGDTFTPLDDAYIAVDRLLNEGPVGMIALCEPLYPDLWQQCQQAVQTSREWNANPLTELARDAGHDAMIKVVLSAQQTVKAGTSPSDIFSAFVAAGGLSSVAAKLAKAGMTADIVCVYGSAAPGATRIENTSTSDQTNACLAASAAPGDTTTKLVRGLQAMGATATGAVVTIWVLWQLLGGPDPRPTPQPQPGPGPRPEPLPPLPILPAPFPTLAIDGDEVTAVAQRIEQVAPQVDPTQAQTAARKCVTDEVRAGDVSRPCLRMPIFLPGQDAGTAAIHDDYAILANPQWFQLTYLSRDAKRHLVPEKWYKATKYKAVCPDKPSIRNAACDEYPFYSSVEGGPGASLWEVPERQNSAEGRALQLMQDDPACDMATSTGGRPRDFPGLGTQKFLVVPTAVPTGTDASGATVFAGPPSTHVCGNVVNMPPSSGGGGGLPT